jgi:hypothetical protein
VAQDERLKTKRDRDFQNKILESLQALTPQKPGAFGRLLKIINSPFFLLLIGLIISFFVFYRQTYVQCVADSRSLYSDYVGLKFELLNRENDVLDVILKAKSMAELRAGLDPKKSFDLKYKDETISGLRMRYSAASAFIDESGINKSAEYAVLNSEIYQKYAPVFSGFVPAGFDDTDLPTLKQLALVVGQVEMNRFFTDLRTEAEILCIPSNVLLNMSGEKPVTIQRFDVGSFSGKERRRLQQLKGRNLLTPRVPPAPFPQTDFKPQEKQPE